MQIPAPDFVCAKISARAAQLATETMKGYGWSNKSIGAITPFPQQGKVGLKTSLKYLMHQERGIRPFIMWWVDGRTIPLACSQGDGPHIRRGKDPGQPGWVNIPHRGRVWREQKWRHPGLKPKNFMQDALKRSIKELGPEIQKELMKALTGGRGN